MIPAAPSSSPFESPTAAEAGAELAGRRPTRRGDRTLKRALLPEGYSQIPPRRNAVALPLARTALSQFVPA